MFNAFRQLVAVQARSEIDGTFPDYRRVVPSMDPKKRATGCFNGNLLSRMCQIGKELGANKNGIAVHSDDPGNPALVKWEGIDFAYGVVMPLRSKPETISAKMPPFFTTTSK